MEQELADKAVSAILSLLTFFLIAEKESKMGFPAFSPKSSKLSFVRSKESEH